MRLPKWARSRWLALVGGIWVMACGGLAYTFSIYSSQLKEAMGYSQQELNTIEVANDIGANVGILSGFLSPLLPDWAMLLLAAIQSVIGNLYVWLAATSRISQPPLWKVFFFVWLGSDSYPFYNTVVLVTCVKNFPLSRGMVVGILKGLVGLSGAIYTLLYTAYISPNQLNFLLLIAFGPAVVSFFAMFMLRPAEPDDINGEREEDEGSNLIFIFIIAIVLALFLLANTLLSAFMDLSDSVEGMAVVIMLILLFSPIFACIRTHINRKKKNIPNPIHRLPSIREIKVRSPKISVSIDEEEAETYRNLAGSESGSDSEDDFPKRRRLSQIFIGSHASEGFLGSYASDDDDVSHRSANKIYKILKMRKMSTADLSELAIEDAVMIQRDEDVLGGDMEVQEAIFTLEFWLLVASMMCGAGTALAVIGNLAQMAEAQGMEDTTVPVALVSIWNFAGRINAGFYSEYLLRSRLVPRPALVAVAQGAMVIGQLLLAFAVPYSIYIGSLIIGIGNGTSYAMLTAITSEIFGLRNFGLLYNLLLTFVPIASYLFSSVIAGTIYDIEAAKQASVTGSVNSQSSGSFFLDGLRRVLVRTKPGMGKASVLGSLHLDTMPFGLRESDSDSLTCYGASCYKITCIIFAVAAFMGMMANIVLAKRTKKLYVRLYGKK